MVIEGDDRGRGDGGEGRRNRQAEGREREEGHGETAGEKNTTHATQRNIAQSS